MLEQLQFSVGTLREDGGAEGLHDLLYGHGLAGKLVFGRAAKRSACRLPQRRVRLYQTRPKAPMPTGCRSVYLDEGQFRAKRIAGYMPHLLVISKVVPKICARTNSAILMDCAGEAGGVRGI
jgi:hypothetical protein